MSTGEPDSSPGHPSGRRSHQRASSEVAPLNEVLVTGGAGYLGVVLTDLLLEAGYRVTVLDRLFFGAEPIANLRRHPRLRVVNADIRDVDGSILEGIAAVVHLAAVSNDPACDLDAELSREINVQATIRLATLSKLAGIQRFLFSSSCSVYGRAAGIVDERSPTAPISLYARTKAQAEQSVLGLSDGGFAVTVLRTATMYGVAPRMRFDLVLNLMTLSAHTSGTVAVHGGSQWRPLIHVRDAATGMFRTILAPRASVAGEVFNLGSNAQNLRIADLARVVREVVPGTQIRSAPGHGDEPSYRVSFNKVHRTLGFEPQRTPHQGVGEVKRALESGGLDDGIRTRTVECYRRLLHARRLRRQATVDTGVP